MSLINSISGNNLLWNNELFSMSELAKECLKKEGSSSESVRGPAHGPMLMESVSKNYGINISRHIKLKGVNVNVAIYSHRLH
jgi:hypothetical protein